MSPLAPLPRPCQRAGAPVFLAISGDSHGVRTMPSIEVLQQPCWVLPTEAPSSASSPAAAHQDGRPSQTSVRGARTVLRYPSPAIPIAVATRPPLLQPTRRDCVPLEGLSRQRPDALEYTAPSPARFIRRFLIHVLPKGFHRIRHYGLFANATAPRTSRKPAHSSTSPRLRRPARAAGYCYRRTTCCLALLPARPADA